MARPLEDEPIRASILDVLSGDISSQGRFAGRQTLSQLIDSVLRSLEELLNTRWRVTSWPPSQNELSQSLANYGIPDFASAQMSSAEDRERFCELVEVAIRLHEPRFVRVGVELIDDTESLDRTLRFRINALLHASPEPAPVAFDSQVDRNSNRIQITTYQR